MGSQNKLVVSLAPVCNPYLATTFHDGSRYESCESNETIDDFEHSNWYCPAPFWAYPVALFGSIIASIGGSAIGGLPTKLAAQWFEPKEYDIANSIASSAGPFGTILVGFLAPLIAQEPADLSNLQVYFSIPILLAFIGSLMIRREGYDIQLNEQSFKEPVDAYFY